MAPKITILATDENTILPPPRDLDPHRETNSMYLFGHCIASFLYLFLKTVDLRRSSGNRLNRKRNMADQVITQIAFMKCIDGCKPKRQRHPCTYLLCTNQVPPTYKEENSIRTNIHDREKLLVISTET